jgi:transcriptional regulator with XRE-family HTH domain
MENTENQRIKIIRKVLKLSQNDFSKAIGITQSALSHYESGANSISLGVLQNIRKVYKINLNWLVSGQGEMIENSYDFTGVSEPQEVYGLRTDNSIEIQRIPLYSMEVAAGITQLYKDNFPTKEYISISNMPKCDGAKYAIGDSMYPLIKSGDIMAYKITNDHNTVLYGQMYILDFILDGEEYELVKFLQKSYKGDDYIKLVSENQHHQPIDIPRKCINGLALVKATIRFHAR